MDGVEYVLAKWLHVLSSTVLFGTGIGSAFYMLMASLGREPRTVAAVVRYVVRADWLFTAPTIVFQPLSGAFLVLQAGYPWHSAWIAWSLAFFALAALCWLPVVWIQIRLRDIAQDAADAGLGLPTGYWRLFRLWVGLGSVAFVALLAIFYLMVARPA